MNFDFEFGTPGLQAIERPVTGIRVWFAGLEDGIEFDLFDNSFTRKWARALRAAVEANANIAQGGTFYGPSIFTKEELVAKMKRCVDHFNMRSGERIELEPRIECDQEFLNELHKEFERLSIKPEYCREPANRDVFQALVDLNSAIHQCEVYTKNPAQHRPSNHFSLDVNFRPHERIKLEDEDFQYFTPNRFWGELYLNYATVGVPVLHAFWNQEVKLPVPQRQFTADFRIGFGRDVEFDQLDELRSWIREKYNWDPDDPKLAIGYVPLGKVRDFKWSQTELFEKVRSKKRVLKVDLLFA